jgi:hypothetical protein
MNTITTIIYGTRYAVMIIVNTTVIIMLAKSENNWYSDTCSPYSSLLKQLKILLIGVISKYKLMGARINLSSIIVKKVSAV